ncbi:MAG TPA: hypothetical protein DCS66_14890, partial [Flavobacteriaceae bacterium]|nr:hypothetical protein [Flavobacteriaceae bacterium]
MKLFLSFFLIVFAEPIVICQTFGSKQIINPDQSGIRMIRTADFDNDEDMDVVVAAFDFITWYRNDGNGNFSAPIVIQEGMGQSFSLAPA